MNIGVRGNTEPSLPGYGNQGDGFIYSSAAQYGLNIISQQGSNKEDYIRFYAGKDADGTIPDMHIQGTGTTKGFVGINTKNPTKRLHINGDTLCDGNLVLGETISGTPVANLSVRADGTIITGSTVPVGTSTNVDASADPNVFGHSIVDYTATSGGGTIYLGDSALLPTGFTVKLIRTGSTTAATLAAGGTSVINSAPTRPLPTAVFSVVTCTAYSSVWYCSTGTVL